MELNIKQILNIKTLKDLLKFKLTKPIFNNNYLFHYLIIFNKFNILKILHNYKKIPIYKENDDNLNGFHLAAKYNILILYFLLDNYSNYIYNKNKENKNFLNYLHSKKLILIYNKYPDLNWNILFTSNIFKEMILNANYKSIINFIDNYKNNFDMNFIDIIINILLSKILNNNNKINILNKFTNIELNKKNNKNEGILIYIDNYNIELIKYLINRNIDICYFSTYDCLNPLFISTIKSILTNDYHIIVLLLNKIINDNNIKYFNQYNKELDTIIHIFLYNKCYINNNIDDNLILFLLNYINNECWNHENIYHESLFDYIVLLDYNIYKKSLKNIKISIHNLKKIINNNNINKKWKKLMKSLHKYTDDNNINFINNKYSHFTFYDAKDLDIYIYLIYIKYKYKNVYIPPYNEFNNNFSNRIIFKNINVYKIDKYLNTFINLNKKKYDYGLIFITIDNINTLHANILIYDFKKMTIERYDPFDFIKSNIDDILEDELTWNTGFKYLKPNINIPNINLQLIANEDNIHNKHILNYSGYCTAWCFYFFEMKILNNNIDTYLLIDKIINKINLSNIKFIDHIRNYSHMLGKERIKFLKKCKVNYNDFTRYYLNNNDYNLVINKLKKYLI